MEGETGNLVYPIARFLIVIYDKCIPILNDHWKSVYNIWLKMYTEYDRSDQVGIYLIPKSKWFVAIATNHLLF